MKKQILLPAIIALGLTVSPLLASQNILQSIENPEMFEDQEKLKLDPNHLPDGVKTAIQNNNATKDLKILEAWQIIEENGKSHYKIKFDNGGNELVKKYDQDGREIKD